MKFPVFEEYIIIQYAKYCPQKILCTKEARASLTADVKFSSQHDV